MTRWASSRSTAPSSTTAPRAAPRASKAQLDRAEQNPHIKAVVLRVNSGGGTATAGEEMAEYLREFSKPVVVSSASINASAAYEISSQADYIFTAKTTSIGAIGTVMQVTDLSGLMEKLGISVDNIASADSKDSSYGTRPLTEEERAYYQAMVDQINESFIETVAQGRGMDVEAVRRAGHRPHVHRHRRRGERPGRASWGRWRTRPTRRPPARRHLVVRHREPGAGLRRPFDLAGASVLIAVVAGRLGALERRGEAWNPSPSNASGRVEWPRRAVVTAGMPYGNKALHFGHIGGVFVPADAFARFLRDRIGPENVRFVSGTDCFGSPIDEGYRKLVESGAFEGTIADYVQRNHEAQKRTLDAYGISLSAFEGSGIGHAGDVHQLISEKFIEKLHENGWLHLQSTLQFYDAQAQTFLNGRQVVGRCPVQGCKSEQRLRRRVRPGTSVCACRPHRPGVVGDGHRAGDAPGGELVLRAAGASHDLLARARGRAGGRHARRAPSCQQSSRSSCSWRRPWSTSRTKFADEASRAVEATSCRRTRVPRGRGRASKVVRRWSSTRIAERERGVEAVHDGGGPAVPHGQERSCRSA